MSLSPRPNLSISLPNGLTNIVPAERSAVSLEKEIMRLQEVLKEREAEISTLEHSLLKATQTESSASSTSDQLRDLKLELDNDHDEPAPESFLSPQTINKFAHIRRSMQFHSENGNSQRDHDSNSASDSMLSDTDDSLDRLNELMLYVAML